MINKFDIYWLNLDPTVGIEIKKTRPCVVISPNELNNNLDTVIVAPITSTIKNWPFRVVIKLNNNISSIALDQIRTISKNRIGDKLGTLNKLNQSQITSVLQIMFDK